MADDLSPEVLALMERWPLIYRIQEDMSKMPEPWSARVIVAGAYKGLVMQAMMEVLDPAPEWVVGFEPQLWAYQEAIQRLKPYPGCIVYPFGLGAKSGRFMMGEWETDACSFTNTGANARAWGEGTMVAAQVLPGLIPGDASKPADLFIMNMEGYEFELLHYMFTLEELLKLRIMPDRLALQLHWDVGGREGLWPAILAQLEEQYTLAVDDSPAWQYWVAKYLA